MTERRHLFASRAASSRSLADPAPAAASGVLDSTREFAAQALERAADKMRDLRYGVVDTASAAQQRMTRYADATGRYMAERPVKSALVAAGIGALVMAFILSSRRRGHRD